MDQAVTSQTAKSSREARYRTAEELARNGPLRVVATHDLQLNRIAAMASCGGTSAQRSAFTQRGQTVARITSNFVVDVYDCGSFEGRPFVVFERPAYTLAEVLGAGAALGLPKVSLVDAARELTEAIACFRLAGVEFGILQPEVVGITESGQVRLSAWPLGNANAKVVPLLPMDTPSDEEQILALLAPAAGASSSDAEALRRYLERGSDTVYSTPLLGAWAAGRLGGNAEAPSDPSTATAQVVVERNVLTRPMVASHLVRGRRPRARYVAAAAAVATLVTLEAVSSLMGQAGVAGLKNREPAAAAVTPKSGTPALGQFDPATSAVPPAALSSAGNGPSPAPRAQPAPELPAAPAPLLTSTNNAASSSTAPKGPTVVGTPATTTTTTVPATTTTTTVPATTTTTTVPETTTTTTPALPGP